MLLQVLGPLEVTDGARRVPPPANKPRVLLLALLAGRHRSATADELIDAIWGERPPASAAKLLQVYVSQLRKRLPAAVAIRTTPTGYRLELPEAGLDADVFSGLVTEGRAALDQGNPALAAAVLRRALGLWRGHAYADVRDEPFAQAEVARLDGLRRLALDARIEADLRLGRHAEVAAELRGLLRDDPTDERLAAHAMEAMYVASGQADALAVYDAVAAALDRELGEAPSSPLTELRGRIIERDPRLDPASVDRGDRPAIPESPNSLVGRDSDVAQVSALLARPGVRLVSLTGAGGAGKTRLALEVARRVAPSFANGAAVVELAALSDPGLLAATVARTLGVEPGAEPERALASALAGQELLLVLDNLEQLRAAGPVIVRLLATAPRLVVLATTRVVLHVSGEHVFPVAPLAPEAASALFMERCAAHDPSFTVASDADRAAVEEICARLDGLPLPLELAAARVRALGLARVRDRLASRLTLLSAGPRDLPARQQTLRETLAWSVNLLDPATAAAFARLAVFPGGCTADAAHQVAGADDAVLVDLVDHHLLQPHDVQGERRYRMLETVREYAAERLGPDREPAQRALVAWARDLVLGAELNAAGAPQEAALGRLDADLETLREALRVAALDAERDAELDIASGMWRYWWIRGLLVEGMAILDGIIVRRGPVATAAGARVVRAAASLAWSIGQPERASAMAAGALDLAVAAGDPFEHIAALNLLGVLATGESRPDDARRYLRESLRIAEDADLTGLAMTARLNLGVAELGAGRLDEARSLLEAVLAHREAEQLSEGIGFARINLGETEFEAGRLAEAEAHYEVAARAFQAVGFRSRHANALQGLAAVEASTGRWETAARRLGVASALLADTGWEADGTSLAPVAARLAREALGDDVFERLVEEGRDSATVA